MFNVITDPIVTEFDSNMSKLCLIEKVGRTCYKSKSDFTEETAIKFVSQLMKNGHYAMFEHAVFVFEITARYLNHIIADMAERVDGFSDLRYFNITNENGGKRILISGSMRALNESGNKYIQGLLLPLRKEYKYHTLDILSEGDTIFDLVRDDVTLVNLDNYSDLTRNEVMNHIYLTLGITCDRGITHEIVRHRNCAFAQESTRYCNYSQDKFNGELTYMRPHEEFFHKGSAYWNECKDLLGKISDLYLKLTRDGVSPQNARFLLPHALKADIVVTANMEEWCHILNLRYCEVTGKAHPQFKQLAGKIYDIYLEKLAKYLGGVKNKG